VRLLSLAEVFAETDKVGVAVAVFDNVREAETDVEVDGAGEILDGEDGNDGRYGY